MLKNPHELQYIQSRAEMNFTVVDEYAKDMEEGLTFEAVKGIESPDGGIWIWDGAHRIEAAKRAGCFVDVELTSGSKDDAEWAALSANTTHGLRRSPADIERVVKHALHHAQAAQKSDREIARHCGVSPTTVGKYRKEITSVHAGQIQRTVKRGDSTYQMNIPERTAPKEETPEESGWYFSIMFDADHNCERLTDRVLHSEMKGPFGQIGPDPFLDDVAIAQGLCDNCNYDSSTHYLNESGRKWCTLSILKNQRLSRRLKADQITVYKKTPQTEDEESGEEDRFQQILEQCQSALGKCFYTKRGIVKVHEVNDIMGLVRGVTYASPPYFQDVAIMTDNFKPKELLYEVDESDWERSKPGRPEPEAPSEEVPEASHPMCAACGHEQERVYVFGLAGIGICQECAETAHRELSSYMSAITTAEAIGFYSADRLKIHHAGFQLYRADWEKKRLNRHTDRGSWIKVEDFPTKKALKERITQLEQDPKVVFDSH